MQRYLAVEIEHTKYARFLSLDARGKKSIKLTTLVDRQKKAEVKVYLIDKGKKQLLYSFFVSSLPPQKAGEPRLLLRGEFDGHTTVSLSLKVNGKLWESKKVSLKKFRRTRSPLLYILPAVLLILIALWLILRSCIPSTSQPPPEESPAPEEVTREPLSTEEEVTKEKQSAAEELAEEEQPAVEKSSQEKEAGQQEGKALPGEETAQTQKEEPAPQESARQTEESPQQESSDKPGESLQQESADQSDKSLQQESSDKPETSGTKREDTQQKSVLPEETIVYFSPDSSTLTQNAREKLDQLVDKLSDNPRAELTIQGHCALYGTEKGRIELSRMRAERVETYLRRSGWDPENTPLVSGLGGTEPVTRAKDRQDLNRRVEINTESR